MADQSKIKSPIPGRPVVTSYDTGYEHSLEHYVYVQRLVEDEEQLPQSRATFAISLMGEQLRTA